MIQPRHASLAAALASLLSACSPRPEAAEPGAPGAEPETAPSILATTGLDPIALTLTLDPAAAGKLKDMGERVIVSAMYYAHARPGAASEEAPDGMLDLGTEEFVVEAASQTLSLSPAPLSSETAERSVDGVVRLLVNVYTAREAAPDNLIHCGIIDGPVVELAGAPQAVSCEML